MPKNRSWIRIHTNEIAALGAYNWTTALYYYMLAQGPCTDRETIANQCCTPTKQGCKWEACVHLSSSSRLCLCTENQFSKEDKGKKCKKISVRKQWELNPHQQKCVTQHMPLAHHCALLYNSSGTMYRPRDEIFF